MNWLPFAFGLLVGCVIFAVAALAYLVAGAPRFIQFCVWLAKKLRTGGAACLLAALLLVTGAQAQPWHPTPEQVDELAQLRGTISHETFAQVNARWDDLQRQDEATYDLDRLHWLNEQMDVVGAELTKRDREKFEADDAQLETLTADLSRATDALAIYARRKWCRRSLWRDLRHYRPPDWCYSIRGGWN
jgi:hypothetical protein